MKKGMVYTAPDHSSRQNNSFVTGGVPERNLCADVLNLALADLIPLKDQAQATREDLLLHRKAKTFFKSGRYEYFCDALEIDPLYMARTAFLKLHRKV